MRRLLKRGPWQTIDSRSASALERVLRDHEPLTTVMGDRYRRDRAGNRTRYTGRFFVFQHEAILYAGPGGFVFPFMLGRIRSHGDAQASVSRLFGLRSRVRTIMGAEEDVSILTNVLGITPGCTVTYDFLALPHERCPHITTPPCKEITLVRPGPNDWRALLQLQMDYEIEEVLLPGRRPIPGHSKAHLLDSLKKHVVLIAMYRGDPIGRVATNARGFLTDQIGGVYIKPAWRERGVATWLMVHLLRLLAEEGRNASLFVKHSNPAAQRLYHGLGFTFVSPFRISYYP